MDEQLLRERAEALCAALLAGDIERATVDLSDALRANLGAFVVLLPLPLTEASVEDVEATFGHVITLHLVGEGGEVHLTTRWKERDGKPTIVEASHVAEEEPEPPTEPDADAAEEGQ